MAQGTQKSLEDTDTSCLRFCLLDVQNQSVHWKEQELGYQSTLVHTVSTVSI